MASYTAASFADPLSTATPSPNGAIGRVPAYTLLDADGGVAVRPWLRVGAGVTNLGDAHYFTSGRRSTRVRACGRATGGRRASRWS